MSVVTILTDRIFRAHTTPAGSKCFGCGGYLYNPYFVWSFAAKHLHLCAACCAQNSKGICADLIQIEAMVELQRLYPGVTLERVSFEESKRRAKALEQEA